MNKTLPNTLAGKHRTTTYVCPHCGRVHKAPIDVTLTGKGYFVCTFCKRHNTVALPQGRYVIAFADDDGNDCKRFWTDHWAGENIVTFLTANTAPEFIELWASICNKDVEDNGMWYWCIDTKPETPVLITSGACDPGDIDIFDEYSPAMHRAVTAYRENGGEF